MLQSHRSVRFSSSEKLSRTGAGIPRYTDVQIVENLFAIYFSWEIVVRFLSFEEKRNCLKDGWFVFDSVLVALMIFETWLLPIISIGVVVNASVLRLFRLARLGRIVRLLKGYPALLTVVKSIVAATRATASVILLMAIFLYVSAIVFKMQLGSSSDPTEVLTPFSSMLRSLHTLFTGFCLGDNIAASTYAIADRQLCAIQGWRSSLRS